MLDLLKQLPIRAFTKARFWLRNRYASHPWPEDVQHVNTAVDVPQADALLQDAHFEDASGYSLKYDGEVLNLRRPAGYGPNGTPLEVHLRARHKPGAREVLQWTGHVEANRFTAMHEHVHEVGLEWLPAERVAELLVDAGGLEEILMMPELVRQPAPGAEGP